MVEEIAFVPPLVENYLHHCCFHVTHIVSKDSIVVGRCCYCAAQQLGSEKDLNEGVAHA